MNTKLISRLITAKQSRETQLQTGVKNTKEGPIALTDKDKVRIEKEIETVSARIDKLKSR